MGFFSKARGKSDGQAYEPTRSGFKPMMKDGKPVLLSQLSKEQMRSTGQGVKPASRSERKGRTEWGSSADFKKAKGR